MNWGEGVTASSYELGEGVTASRRPPLDPYYNIKESGAPLQRVWQHGADKPANQTYA